MKEQIKKAVIPAAAILASIGIGFAGIASAQASPSGDNQSHRSGIGRHMGGERPAVVGTVTAVSGSTITVSNTNPQTSVVTIYSVDISSAAIKTEGNGSGPVDGTIADITVGDMVAIKGTVSGTSVVATNVMDGIKQGGPRGGMGEHGKAGAHGTVTSVNGSTITIEGENGTIYTIDGADAAVSRISTITMADIKVGDTVGARGVISGTNVTATQIMNGALPRMER